MRFVIRQPKLNLSVHFESFVYGSYREMDITNTLSHNPRLMESYQDTPKLKQLRKSRRTPKPPASLADSRTETDMRKFNGCEKGIASSASHRRPCTETLKPQQGNFKLKGENNMSENTRLVLKVVIAIAKTLLGD